MAITWNSAPQSTAPTTGTSPAGGATSGGGIKWNSGGLDASMGALASSQASHDQLKAKAASDLAASTAASQQANSPAGIAAETATGTVGGIANNALRFMQSAVHAPMDIFNSLTGKQQDQSVLPNFSGEGQQTYQGEFQSKTIPAVESGQIDPRSATLGTVSNVVGGAGDVLGLDGAGKLASGAVDYLGKTKLGGIVQDFAAKRAEKAATQSTIEAVSPELTGKKLVQAYKQTVTGGRSITPASMFQEQGLTPDQKTINLGTRLRDLNLGKDPAANLDSLEKGMTDTEAKLGTALKGDPSLQYTADKPTLFNKLNDVKTTAPQEFRIKDSQAMVNNVVNFATKTVNAGEDTLKGIRDSRTAFDTQARTEFPNAFKPDGTIDTKTPAGYAIKAARDVINEHLYNTAPNGSEIQKLIGREADIFKATDNIAPKAAQGQGKNKFQQLAARYPNLSKYVGWGLGALGAEQIVKKTTGLGP